MSALKISITGFDNAKRACKPVYPSVPLPFLDAIAQAWKISQFEVQ